MHFERERRCLSQGKSRVKVQVHDRTYFVSTPVQGREKERERACVSVTFSVDGVIEGEQRLRANSDSERTMR